MFLYGVASRSILLEYKPKENAVNNALKIILGIFVGTVLLAGAFSGGFLVGNLVDLPGGATSDVPPQISTPVADPSSATPSETDILFQPFWEAWNLVHESYVDQPVDDEALMRGAIEGMLEVLGDPYTSYMNPDEVELFTAPLEGEYEGIGAWVDTGGDFLTIISPIPDSPAEAAGLRSGDIILAIDGKDMTGVDPELARKQVLGPAGSVVTLTIKRGDEEPFDVAITRAKIIVKSVEGKMLDNGIAYVQITTFGDKTSAELQVVLEELMAQNPKGLILDLRNNGGGYLQSAIEVTSQFIPADEVVLHERYGNGDIETHRSLGEGLATDVPMVVLINEATASASEIVAGALQDLGRAKLVGVVSYGKGSVQIMPELSNNQGAVKITIAKWLTPNERIIHEIGLSPEVYVVLTEEDFKNGLDPQLDAAIETLLAMIAGTPIPTSMPTVTPLPTP